MKKKTITAALALAMMTTCFTGCACKHEWSEATCSAPKTCTLCNETEGETLEHTWTEANYQNPETCSVCGETTGTKWEASFEKHGLKAMPVEEGVEHSYVAACYGDNTKKTTGGLYLSDYNRFESDETHEGLEGYEWVTVTAKIRFDDENATKYGMTVSTCQENYYDVEGWDNSKEKVADGVNKYTVNWNGVEYDQCLVANEPISFSKWENNVCWSTNVFYFRVPCNYDGMVVGFRDDSVKWEDGQYIFDVADENTLFFRLA